MLQYVKLKLTFKTISDIYLPEYKGSTLRGMFKTSFKRACCAISSTFCKDCMLAKQCVYALISEHRTESGENTVLPYAISCFDLKTHSYAQGENVSFEFLLVGQAVSYFPYIVYSLTTWDKLDISRFQPLITGREILIRGEPAKWDERINPRGKIRLEKVEQISKTGLKLLYQRSSPLLSPNIELLSCETTANSKKWLVKIDFLSPVRIFRKIKTEKKKKEKKLVQPESFNFMLFFRSLLTRYSGLYIHFDNGPADFGHSVLEQVKTDIEKVDIVKNNLVLEKVRRYKRNNTKWVHLDGLMGEVVFANVSDKLIPWIKAGELIHAGKFPTLGFGEYSVKLGRRPVERP